MSQTAAGKPLRIGPRGVAAILLVGLVGAMAIEPTRQLLRQRDRISGMASDLEAVHESNERLERQIARLNNDDYIEQKAREQIGLVRPGETAILVVPPSKKAQSANKPDADKRRVQIEENPGFLDSLAHFLGFGS